MDTTTEHGGGGERAGGPFVSECCEGARCMCGQPAVRKIAEVVFHDDPLPGRHELTAYVCADHFIMVMGKRTGLETLASRPAQPAAPEPNADGGGGGEGLTKGYWEAHSGEDYSVVMRPNETTDSASIRLAFRDPNLAAHIAVSLNRALASPVYAARLCEALEVMGVEFVPDSVIYRRHDR